VRTLEGHKLEVRTLAWSPDGRTLASGSPDGTVRFWDSFRGEAVGQLEGAFEHNYAVAWSPDGRVLAGGDREAVVLWDPLRRKPLGRLVGHNHGVYAVAWSPDGRMLASGSGDDTVRLWEWDTGRQTNVLEGHTRTVRCVSFSSDGRLIASSSEDGTVRLWRCDTWKTVAELAEPTSKEWPSKLDFHPRLSVLATFGEGDQVVRIWDLDLATLLGGAAAGPAVRYTTAKIVLVGDSGVGKTGLGWRLAHGQFKDHPSTHGQQFWLLDTLGGRRPDGTECEAVLWDLAGQPDYRLIHALFLDDADLALVLFNPTDRQEPLHGVDFWLKALAHRQGRRCRTILVGARLDRGDATLTSKEIDAFCRARGITGGYVGTSARTGTGLDELLARIKDQIAWDDLTATTTTVTFKRIKEYVLSLKEDAERHGVLAGWAALRGRLKALDGSWKFSKQELRTAVDRLAKHGYVRVLRTAAGKETVLLVPELLNNLAASFVLEARRNPKGLGALDEQRVLTGAYSFPELSGLEPPERDVLLDAAMVLFLEHNICFRESLGPTTFLVFPELINRKKPRLQDEAATEDDVSYTVTGAVENVYAALVVLLGYTNDFTRTDQWQNQAQYEVGAGEVCGFRQVAEREGEIDLVLYYGPTAGPDTRRRFRVLFEKSWPAAA
jgi:GTPase SAR1 family protein